jgi:hypothetical protein
MSFQRLPLSRETVVIARRYELSAEMGDSYIEKLTQPGKNAKMVAFGRTKNQKLLQPQRDSQVRRPGRCDFY